jgi:hypothetical protein
MNFFSRDLVAQIELLAEITESLGVPMELWIRTTKIAVSSAAVNTLDMAPQRLAIFLDSVHQVSLVQSILCFSGRTPPSTLNLLL